MAQELLWLTIPLIALTMAVYMAYWLITKIRQMIETTKKVSPGGVVKRDWLPTGRVDFTTRLNGADDQNKEQPGEFISFSVKRELSYRPTNGGSEAVLQST